MCISLYAALTGLLQSVLHIPCRHSSGLAFSVIAYIKILTSLSDTTAFYTFCILHIKNQTVWMFYKMFLCILCTLAGCERANRYHI